MSIILVLAFLVGGVLLGLSLLAKADSKKRIGFLAHQSLQQLLAMSALLVPAVMVLSACNSSL